jgi:hypothetical protein
MKNGEEHWRYTIYDFGGLLLASLMRKPMPDRVVFLSCLRGFMGILAIMINSEVKKILDRVLTWPPERQDAAARILIAMEEQDAGRYQLTDEQVEEVKRRLAEPNRTFLTLDQARDRFVQRRA